MSDQCLTGVCDGVPTDFDGDTFTPVSCGGTDCDDGRVAVNPSASEGPWDDRSCDDGRDNDCDGAVDVDDEGCTSDCPGLCTVDEDCTECGEASVCNPYHECCSFCTDYDCPCTLPV
jgi:hypothetical protein